MLTSVPTLAPLPLSLSATGNAASNPKCGPRKPNDDNPNQKNPRRPQNSFFLFFAEKRGARPDKMPLSSYAKQIAVDWRALSPEERNVYEERAEEVKLRHARKYPSYQYRPRKGGTKRAAWGTRAPKKDRKPTISLSPSTPPVEAAVPPVQHTTPGIPSQTSGYNGNGPADEQPMVGSSANPFSPLSQVEQLWSHPITEPLVLHQVSAASSQSPHSSLTQSPLSYFSQSPLSSSNQSPLTSPSLSFTSEMGINSFHHSPLPSSNWDSPPPEEMYPPFIESLEDFFGHAPLPPHYDTHPSSLTLPVLDTNPVPAQYSHTLDPAQLFNAEVPESLPAENQSITDFFPELYPWAVPEYSVDSGVFSPGYGPEPSFIGTWSY